MPIPCLPSLSEMPVRGTAFPTAPPLSCPHHPIWGRHFDRWAPTVYKAPRLGLAILRPEIIWDATPFTWTDIYWSLRPWWQSDTISYPCCASITSPRWARITPVSLLAMTGNQNSRDLIAASVRWSIGPLSLTEMSYFALVCEVFTSIEDYCVQ